MLTIIMFRALVLVAASHALNLKTAKPPRHCFFIFGSQRRARGAAPAQNPAAPAPWVGGTAREQLAGRRPASGRTSRARAAPRPSPRPPRVARPARMTASPAQVDVSCPASRVMDAPTISCLECNQRLEEAYLGMATIPWQVAAFENHTPKPVALNELTTGGEEKFVATLAPAEALYFFSRMGAVWRARDEEGEMPL